MGESHVGWIKQSKLVAFSAFMTMNLAALSGCESQIKANKSDASSGVSSPVVPVVPPPDVVTNPTDTATATQTKTDVIVDKPVIPQPKKDVVDDSGTGTGTGTTTQKRPNYMSGITSYADMNIPLPPDSLYKISNLQISDAPTTQIGSSAHFKLKGGVFMSR